MTGYGRACKTLHGREITVELRSVNNRFLDCSVRLPRAFSYAEDAIKQLVKDAVQRGKVDVFVSVNAAGAEEATVSLNRPVLEGYLRAMRTMVADYGVQDDISASALSALPDIFVVEKPEEDEKQNLADLTAVAAEAIAVYQTMRETEGAAMAADLSSRAETIRGLVGRIEERSPVTLTEYRTRLETKLREVLASTTIDESRILTEAAIFADRIAVDEETVRLRSHLAQLDSLLAEILLLQSRAHQDGETALLADLEVLAGFTRRILGAEVKDEPLAEGQVLGMDAAQIRHASHNLKGTLGIEHPIPDYRMPLICLELNRLRTRVREAELYAAHAFEAEDGSCPRVDLVQAMNRLSSCVYLLFCRKLAGYYDRRHAT